jgi:hypothetical protein
MQLNLQLVKKDTQTYILNVTREDGTVADISGWIVEFTIKNDFNDLDINAKLIKSFTMPNNVESQAGIGYLELTSAETDIDLGEYYYDMKFIATGYRETFLRGKLVVVPTIRIA